MENPANFLVPNISMDHQVVRDGNDSMVSHVSRFMTIGGKWISGFLDIRILGTSKDRKKVGLGDIFQESSVYL